MSEQRRLDDSQFGRLMKELTGIRRAVQGLAALLPIAVVILLLKG